VVSGEEDRIRGTIVSGEQVEGSRASSQAPSRRLACPQQPRPRSCRSAGQGRPAIFVDVSSLIRRPEISTSAVNQMTRAPTCTVGGRSGRCARMTPPPGGDHHLFRWTGPPHAGLTLAKTLLALFLEISRMLHPARASVRRPRRCSPIPSAPPHRAQRLSCQSRAADQKDALRACLLHRSSFSVSFDGNRDSARLTTLHRREGGGFLR